MNTLESLLAKLTAHHPIIRPTTPLSAAVLVLLTHDTDNNLSFIMTKRPDSIKSYAGDYCFPGGMRDPGDVDLQMTATREVQEELSLTLSHYQIIHQLDDFHDRYKNLVRPFIAIINQADFEQNAILSPTEIAEIYYFPLTDLHRLERNPSLEQLINTQPAYSYTNGSVFIWGLTARILVHLRTILLGEPSTEA